MRPFFFPLAVLPAALVALTGCIGGPDAAFPSLLPRPAEAARDLTIRAETPSGISTEERAELASDIDRVSQRVADASTAAEMSGHDLDRALAGARGAVAGDAAWVDAQVALSRFEQARSALGDNRTQVSALLARADALAPQDLDRQRTEALADTLNAAERAATARSIAAGAILSPPR